MSIDTGEFLDGASAITGGCGGSCSNDPPAEMGRLLFDQETGNSTVFDVLGDPIVVHVLQNHARSTLRLERVYGCGAGDIYAPLLTIRGPVAFPAELPDGSASPGAVLVLPLTGRYRLIAQIDRCAPDDLCVIVTENKVDSDALSLMV